MQLHTFLDFFDACGRDAASVVNPRVINFWNRCQYLCNTNMEFKKANAFKQFLSLAKEFEPAQLREIVIDSCRMSDESLAEILAGTAAQVKYVLKPGDDKPQRRQFLYNIVYSNNQIGLKSLEQLKLVSTDIIEMRLNNCAISHHKSFLTNLSNHF